MRSAARIGGEEFVVLLPGENPESAVRVAEEIRQAMIRRAVPHPSSPSGVQTVSVGVAAVVPQDGQSMRELLRLADRALYRAKDSGRDRVYLA
jgi:diguanylate cyclase (GGDEF)-like protein